MLGDIISAGTALIGGQMAADSADKSRALTLQLARENMALQKEFAQQGLTWKIDDAFRNSERVHPIYSLGASGASYTPVSANFQADTSMGNAVAAAGQHIGRAVNATASQSQREDAFTKASQAVQLEHGVLSNDLLRTQIASENARLRQTSAPPFPAPGDVNAYLIPGQGNSPLIKNKPLEITPAASNQPQSEGGAITDVGYARTSTGWAPVPSKDVKERIEDNIIQEVMHAFRNNLLPTLGLNKSPPPYAAPKGKEWHFNPLRQEYQLFDNDSTWARINRPMNQYKRYRWVY